MVGVQLLSCVRLFDTLWTVAHQTLLPWDCPGENAGVGCHFLFQVSSQPRDQTCISLSPALQADSLSAEPSCLTIF